MSKSLIDTWDDINLFSKRLREFCNRNNIEMGMDLRDDRPKERKYVFVNPRNKTTQYCFEGFYIVVDFDEVEDISETFECIIHELISRFELYIDTDTVYATALETVVKHPIYISTATNTNKVFDRLTATIPSSENPYFTQGFEIDEALFHKSPVWVKKALDLNSGIFGNFCKKEKEMKPTIEKVYFNKPYTIVLWSDKTKTMVKAENEAYDEEKGLAMAICKKFLGTNKSKGNYFDEFKKWLPKIEGGPVKEEREYRRYVTAKEFAELSKVDISTVRKHCRIGLITGAIKQSGAWLIPIKPREGKMEV